VPELSPCCGKTWQQALACASCQGRMHPQHDRLLLVATPRAVASMLAADLEQDADEVERRVQRHVDQGHGLLVHRAHGLVVAALFAVLWYDLHRDAPTFYVDYLHVAKLHRGRGVGAALMTEARDLAPTLGADRITLHEAHPGLAPFYAALGFSRSLVGAHTLVLANPETP